MSVNMLHIYILAVDGRWGSWKQVGSCSKTCGGGVLKFARACNRPAPSCGGLRCAGISIFEVQCNRHCCKGKMCGFNLLYAYIQILEGYKFRYFTGNFSSMKLESFT